MNFLETVILIDDACEELHAKWGDDEADTWQVGIRTRFKMLGHLAMQLKQAIINGEGVAECLTHIAALCIYWLMSDYEYNQHQSEHSLSKEGDNGYL